MKRMLLILVMLPLVVIAQDNGKKFSLNGKIHNLPDSVKPEWIFLQYRVGDDLKVDSVQPRNGKYSFSGMIIEPVQGRLRIRFAETSPGKRPALVSRRDATVVFLEPGKQKIASADSFSNIKVKGSAIHAEYVRLEKQVKPYNDRLQPLYATYSMYAKAKDKAGQDKTEEEIDAIDKEKRENVYAEYVKKQSGSPLALYALQQYAGWDIDAAKVEPLYELLPKSSLETPSAILFKENLEIAKKTGIGKLAMDFTQNDTLGKPITLSSLRGKYLLIDFWASWCGPCRAENPNVVRVFNKYRNNNFHIIGVSLDRPGQKERWMKAIHDDGLAWTQVSDLKYWDNEVAKQYGVRAIPQNLLLDPEGRIIGRNLRGDELDVKLGEAIEGKKAF
ncbi:MAG: AhpC/TSA family protein [Chitinophagaceae bacterium]|nr:AhpC/TSA family protein [Chitinophagaceae bacterium]